MDDPKHLDDSLFFTEISSDYSQLQHMIMEMGKASCFRQLLRGMTHEINNPLSYLISNTRQLESLLSGMVSLLIEYDKFLEDAIEHNADLDSEQLEQIAIRKENLGSATLFEDVGEILRDNRHGLDAIQYIIGNIRDVVLAGETDNCRIDVNDELIKVTDALGYQLAQMYDYRRELGEVPPVCGNTMNLKLALLHLLLNSLERIETQGRIAIETRYRDGHVVIETIDNGGSLNETGPEGGRFNNSNLYLYIVRMIAASFGGALKISRTETGETSFSLILPSVESGNDQNNSR